MKLKNTTGIVLLLFLSLSACDEWPPHSEELMERHGDRLDQLEQLKQMVSDHSLVALRHGSAASYVYISRDADKVQEALDSPLGQKLRRMLEEADIYAVYNDGRSFFFDPSVSAEDDKYWYRVRIVYDNEGFNTQECKAIKDRSKEDTCQIEFDNGWRLEYSWFPLGDS
jgi:hypothetical protein